MYSFLGKTFKREVDVYVVMRRGSPLAQARDDRCCFIVLLDKMEERNVVMMSPNLGCKGWRSSSFPVMVHLSGKGRHAPHSRLLLVSSVTVRG